MADFLYVCVLLCILIVEGAHRHISGLYCRDPDTGKLYEVNSTWVSKSFCGNYTCKISKRNVTETEYAPLIKINITNDMLEDEKVLPIPKNDIKNIELTNPMEENSKKSSPILDMAISPSKVSSIISNASSISNEVAPDKNIATKSINTIVDKTDRFLTESEIKVITDILHTVKKSDLEAIIDVYNLAQEIYNEMEANKEATRTSGHIKLHKAYLDGQLLNSKDVKSESTSRSTTARTHLYPASYYRELLTEKDIRQLPYYYPMSDFHRMLSYVYTMPPKSDIIEHKPCNKQRGNDGTTTRYSTSIRPTRANIEEKSYTSIPMLTFPFFNVRHSINDDPSFYYNFYPWAQLDMYNKNRYNVPNYFNNYYPQEAKATFKTSKQTKLEQQSPNMLQPEESAKLKKNKDNQEATFPDLEKISLGNKNDIKKETNNNLPSWQTAPLSQQVIDEVRANVMDNTKFLNIFPRKPIHLEKVGKVIKLDELTRSKREIESNQESIDLGVKLEKIECVTSTEPGYFSVGNLNEPYPACCPQKILPNK